MSRPMRLVLESMARGLTITPPGTWFDNKGFAVFVGGSGHGERPTLLEAEAYLVECANSYCGHRIAEAEATARHWKEARVAFMARGLQEAPAAAPREDT